MGSWTRHMSPFTDKTRRARLQCFVFTWRQANRLGFVRSVDSHLVDFIRRARALVSRLGRHFWNLLEQSRGQSRRFGQWWISECTRSETVTQNFIRQKTSFFLTQYRQLQLQLLPPLILPPHYRKPTSWISLKVFGKDYYIRVES